MDKPNHIRVMFVDDDPNLLNGLKRMLRKEFDVFTSTDPIEAMRTLDKKGPFSVIVSDQNMPRVEGSAFLAKVRQHFPDVVRVMLTGNNDGVTAQKAVNTGHVFSLLTKPCEMEELTTVIRDADARYQRIISERAVLEETVGGSIKLMTDMLAMAYPDTFKRTKLVKDWAKAAAPRFDVPLNWELKMACTLWPLSDVLSPPELVSKREFGLPLTEKEQATLLETSLNASQLLGNIPRLQGVSKLILMSTPAGLKAFKNTTPSSAARLLHLLVSLAREVDPAKPDELDGAFERLSISPETFDKGMFAALPEILKSAARNRPNAQVLEVMAGSIREGDLLVADLHDDKGRLLLASGQTISKVMALTLERMQQNGDISCRVKVVRASEGAADEAA